MGEYPEGILHLRRSGLRVSVRLLPFHTYNHYSGNHRGLLTHATTGWEMPDFAEPRLA